ncbi:MAG: DMT family transporter [Anaerolineae bacterium]
MSSSEPVTMSTLDQTLGTRFLQSRLGRHVTRGMLSRRGLGLLVVLLSAAGFGAVTPFARLAYDGGVNVVTVMVVRYALAGLAVTGYLTWRRQPWRLAGRRLWHTLGLALLLGVLSFTYLRSIRYIPVSLAALIYYTYPLMVTLLTYVTGEEKLANEDRRAHVLTFGGQVLSLAGLVLLLGLAGTALNLAGVLMAAFSAVSFAMVMVFGSQLMRTVPPMVLNLYVALVNTPLFGVAGALGAGLTWPAVAMDWIGLMGAAVFFVLGFLGLFVGVAMIGPSRAACLTNMEPVVTIALAITVLGEPFGIWQFIGAAAVLIGIFTMCRNMLTASEEEGET